MALLLLPTKISIPPSPQKTLRRAHLMRRLEESLDRPCPLILLSAPAGFGKTTLVLQWLQEYGRSAAWLSLDGGDSQPLRFWRYVWAALREHVDDLGSFPEILAREMGETGPHAAVTALIDLLAQAPGPILLILEDYHTLDAAGEQAGLIHESVGYFLDYLPPQVHVLITTRSDPPLDLSRRRARGQLLELRGGDLRLEQGEVDGWLNALLGLDIEAEHVAVLAERTEGWPAGLQMVALALQSSSLQQQRSERDAFIGDLAGTDRYIADYLMEEVLQRQPEDLVQFLLQTSILDRFNARLCAALVASDGADFDPVQDTLRQLEEANLFIVPLDHQRRWYRYHQLFSDLLRQRLRYSYSDDQIATLHKRASGWYERHEYVSDAVEHALAAGDDERMAQLVEQRAFSILFRSETDAVAGWLAAMPDSLFHARPHLCLIRAWSALLQEKGRDDVEERLNDVERAMAATEVGTEAEQWLLAHVATLQAFMARVYDHDFQGAVARSQEALSRAREDERHLRATISANLGLAHLALGEVAAARVSFDKAHREGLAHEDHYPALTGIVFQALIARFQGRLQEAAAICRRALASIVLPAAQRQQAIPYGGAVYGCLGTVLYQWNRLDEAAAALEQAVDLLRFTGEYGLYIFSLSELARVRHAQGQVTTAESHLVLAGRIRRTLYPGAVARQLQLMLPEDGHVHKRVVTHGDADGLALSLTLPGIFRYTAAVAEVEDLIRRRATEGLVGSPWQDVGQWLEKWREEAAALGWTEREIELCTLQALAHNVDGRVEQAGAVLQCALELAEPAGYQRLFIDRGPEMAALLYQAAERGVAVDYAGELLGHFPKAGQQNKEQEPHPPRGLVEPLSEREREVLTLISRGLTNREIAVQLSIALSTVKAHARNIYGKLNVGNRTEAVARARELQLKF